MEMDEARRPRRDEKRRHRAARETTSREDAPTATRRGDATPPRASCYLLWTPLARIARAGPLRARTTARPPCVEPRDATSNLRRVPLRRVRNINVSVWPGGRFQFYHFTHPSGSTFDRDAFQLTAGGTWATYHALSSSSEGGYPPRDASVVARADAGARPEATRASDRALARVVRKRAKARGSMASASLASPLTSPKKESSRGYFRRGTSVVAPNAVTTTARVAATRRVAPGAATAAPSSSRRLHGAGARRRVVARAEGEASRRISGAGVAGDGASDAVDRVHGARQSAQAKSLEARLAEVSAQTPWAGGAAAPPADRKGKDDWARWSETFDRVDGEEGILDALRVRAPRAEKRPPFVHCIHSFVRAILSSSLRLVSE